MPSACKPGQRPNQSIPSNPLTAYGWSPAWAEHLPLGLTEPMHIGRIIAAHRTCCEIITDSGPATATTAGHFHQVAAIARPVAGDWVCLRQEAGASVIDAIMPRRTLLRRVAAGGQDGDQAVAANVDTVLIVGGLDGDHEPRRLRRYISFVAGGGARPVIILNKADLAVDLAGAIADLAGIAPDIPVHPVSATAEVGLEALAAYLVPGHTLACVGSSGVGKSTLINRLLGLELQATGEVRADDSRGRHTTTNRVLIPHPSGAVIMDTPGMRELALSAEASDLDAGFHDLVTLAESCRFRDCTHQGEPGCAVQAAIDRGQLPPARRDDWAKLEREAAYDRERRHERHARERQFGRMVKAASKRKGRW
jgi:ribosome biogenesis GTPase